MTCTVPCRLRTNAGADHAPYCACPCHRLAEWGADPLRPPLPTERIDHMPRTPKGDCPTCGGTGSVPLSHLEAERQRAEAEDAQAE